MRSISLSDAGKTKIAIRFDENDGILKYYKEFGSISCVVRGPPSTVIKVRLLDHTRKEVDQSILTINNGNSGSYSTDTEGKCSLTVLVTKGCQAYECMFFMLSVSWASADKDEVNSYLSCPFVSGSKGPAEPPSEKNRFRPLFLSTTGYNDFKNTHIFISEIITQKERVPVTQIIHDKRELRTYYQSYVPGLFDTPPSAHYYRAKTRSQSHKADPNEVSTLDVDAKLKEKITTQAIVFAQFIAKSYGKKLLNEEECGIYKDTVPQYFRDCFLAELNQAIGNINGANGGNLLSPKLKHPRAVVSGDLNYGQQSYNPTVPGVSFAPTAANNNTSSGSGVSSSMVSLFSPSGGGAGSGAVTAGNVEKKRKAGVALSSATPASASQMKTRHSSSSSATATATNKTNNKNSTNKSRKSKKSTASDSENDEEDEEDDDDDDEDADYVSHSSDAAAVIGGVENYAKDFYTNKRNKTKVSWEAANQHQQHQQQQQHNFSVDDSMSSIMKKAAAASSSLHNLRNSSNTNTATTASAEKGVLSTRTMSTSSNNNNNDLIGSAFYKNMLYSNINNFPGGMAGMHGMSSSGTSSSQEDFDDLGGLFSFSRNTSICSVATSGLPWNGIFSRVGSLNGTNSNTGTDAGNNNTASNNNDGFNNGFNLSRGGSLQLTQQYDDDLDAVMKMRSNSKIDTSDASSVSTGGGGRRSRNDPNAVARELTAKLSKFQKANSIITAANMMAADTSALIRVPTLLDDVDANNDNDDDDNNNDDDGRDNDDEDDEDDSDIENITDVTDEIVSSSTPVKSAAGHSVDVTVAAGTARIAAGNKKSSITTTSNNTGNANKTSASSSRQKNTNIKQVTKQQQHDQNKLSAVTATATTTSKITTLASPLKHALLTDSVPSDFEIDSQDQVGIDELRNGAVTLQKTASIIIAAEQIEPELIPTQTD